MRVTAEMSLYPLQGQPIEKILAFIETITSEPRTPLAILQPRSELTLRARAYPPPHQSSQFGTAIVTNTRERISARWGAVGASVA